MPAARKAPSKAKPDFKPVFTALQQILKPYEGRLKALHDNPEYYYLETHGPTYESIRQRTRNVIKTIPPDKFDWTYQEGKFTFADLVRHIAAVERYMFAENVRLRPSRYPGHGKDLADGPENVLAFFDRMHEETI